MSGGCQKDGHGNCQHVVFDSENERWTIPSGTHIFLWHTVFADTFTDYLATSNVSAELPKDDLVGELGRNTKQATKADGSFHLGRFLTTILPYLKDRDRRIWNHAYELGRQSKSKLKVTKESK